MRKPVTVAFNCSLWNFWPLTSWSNVCFAFLFFFSQGHCCSCHVNSQATEYLILPVYDISHSSTDLYWSKCTWILWCTIILWKINFTTYWVHLETKDHWETAFFCDFISGCLILPFWHKDNGPCIIMQKFFG